MILLASSMPKNIHTNQLVRFSLRQTLADSHVAAITIAWLLLASVESIFYGLWEPSVRLGYFTAYAIAIRDIPLFSEGMNEENLMIAITALNYFYFAIASGFAAAFLSLWVYGVGPITSLRRYRKLITRRNRA
jgi:hypothetical protein